MNDQNNLHQLYMTSVATLRESADDTVETETGEVQHTSFTPEEVQLIERALEAALQNQKLSQFHNQIDQMLVSKFGWEKRE